jgi:transposase
MWQGCLGRGQALEMWVMDEHRIGLKPLLRRIWAPCGQRRIVRIQPRYEWLYAFAHPNSGRSFYLLMPTVSIVAFSIALSEFATFVGANTHRHILLLLDKAGWHISPEVEKPTGVGLRFLPAYSPELQPAEHLWQLTDVPLVNHWFAALDDLETALAERCSWLQDQHALLRSTTLFHGWPALV